jgi:hypothetical protein
MFIYDGKRIFAINTLTKTLQIVNELLLAA